MANDARVYKHVFVAGNATIFTLISMRATRRSSSETIRSSAREECNHAGAPHARPTCMPLARMLLGAALPVATAGGYD